MPATCSARQGTTPLYLGQPVALLLFETFDAFDRARVALRDGSFVRLGAETGPLAGANYGAFRFTRIAGPTPDSPDVYSPIQEGWVSPGKFESGGRPIWEPLPIATGRPYAKAATYGEEIRAGLAVDDPDLLVLDRAFETQSVDPMFLEPECGLAWYDAGDGRSRWCSACSRPSRRRTRSASCSARPRRRSGPSGSTCKFAYLGGGFGGRDHTPFPLYVALAAMFLPDRPVRLAHDRFQQFQGGIKRHAFKMRSQIGIDRTTGKMTAFAADHVLDGGGLANYSASVAVVGATGAIGIYDVPKVDVTTVASIRAG